MWRKVGSCLLAGSLMAIAVSAQTAGQLAAKNIQARGGGKLRSLKTIRMSGKFTSGGTEGSPLLVELAPPGHKVRLETTEKGQTDIRAYDGSVGWTWLRSEGEQKPTTLAGDALKDIKDSADFEGGLYDFEAKGNQVEYLGKDDVSGTPAYKLKLTERDGKETTIYLDAKTYLEIREESIHGNHGDIKQFVTTYSDYKQIDGLTVPMTITTTSKEEMGGGAIRIEGEVVFAFDKVEVNVDLPASRFAKP